MTIQGAMKELVNLLNADDIPVYYKGGIKKVIETIDDYIDGKDDYVKRMIDRKTEPQTDYDKGLQLFADILFDKKKGEQFLKECKTIGIEPQTEREGE